MNNCNKLLLSTFTTVTQKSDTCIFDELIHLIILQVIITRGTRINSTSQVKVESCQPKGRTIHSMPFKGMEKEKKKTSCFLPSLCEEFIMYKRRL